MRVQVNSPTDPTLSPLFKFITVCAVAALITLLGWYVPPNMDIFLPYHPLACHYYPNAVYNIFDAPCSGVFDIKILGFIPWPRAHDFQGFGGLSLLYFPLFLLFPYWQSAIVMGGLWLIATVWLFIRITGVNPWIALLAFGTNFFLVYNTLYDVGPIGLHLTLVYAIPYLTGRILNAKTDKTRLWLNIALGTLVFLGIEYRLLFLYFLPGSALLTLVLYRQPGESWLKATWRLAKHCDNAITLTIILLLLLMFGRTSNGQFYWTVMQSMSWHYPHFHSAFSYLQHLRDMTVTYLLNFHASGGILYGAQDLGLLSLPVNYKEVAITSPFWIITAFIYRGFYRCRQTAEDKQEWLDTAWKVAALLAAGMVTLLLVSSNEKSRHAFHIIPVMADVAGSAALCLDYLRRHQKIRLALVSGALAASQIAVTLTIVTQKALVGYSWDRMPALDYVRQPAIAEHALISHMDWGTYYISSLYGPKEQLVTFTPTIPDQWNMQRLLAVAHQHNRYLVLVMNTVRIGPKTKKLKELLPTLQKVFPVERIKTGWEVWAEPEPYGPFPDENATAPEHPDRS